MMRRQFTPKGFEAYVVGYMRKMGHLEGRAPNAFKVSHREIRKQSDGDFELDVVVRFRSFGVNLQMLIECKHLQRKVEREVIQLLRAKLLDLNVHKGIVFSTSGFQKGALLYAKEHRIALVDCSARHNEPVTIIGGEPTAFDRIERDSGPPPIAPASFDWVFHWGGQSFCAEHWYAAQVLFRAPSDLQPPPRFWHPPWVG